MVVIPTRRHSTRGAAAVEFALVFPLLAVIMFGVIQYGLYFYDAHGTRTGVREAARMGVVQTDITGTCNNASYLVELKCETKRQVDAVTGPIAIRVEVGGTTPVWQRGAPLVVCAEVKSSIIGFLPMPDDGLIQSKTQMSIEVDSPIPPVLFAQDTSLSGSWSWC